MIVLFSFNYTRVPLFVYMLRNGMAEQRNHFMFVFLCVEWFYHPRRRVLKCPAPSGPPLLILACASSCHVACATSHQLIQMFEGFLLSISCENHIQTDLVSLRGQVSR